MKRISYLGIFLFVNCSVFSQQNPIIFIELFGGYSGGSSQGWTGSVECNFQNKEDLFTVRYLGLINTKVDYSLILFPIFKTEENINEIALMYGKRYIFDNKSLSFSGGIASLKRDYLTIKEDFEFQNRDNYFGFPFELNIKWFQAYKEKYRIYGIIPIGKPISFGRSVGFKIVGNISKTSFIGLGVSYGFGFHKIY